jgi:hypothetical protein
VRIRNPNERGKEMMRRRREAGVQQERGKGQGKARQRGTTLPGLVRIDYARATRTLEETEHGYVKTKAASSLGGGGGQLRRGP